jgi:DNA invertase Pin-like site-specific DNA recombinase
MRHEPTPKIACLYLRTARRKQSRYDDRLAHQHAVCLAAAASIGVRITKTYVDYGFSGNTERRPALTRMMRDLARGRTHYVVMASRDRLARSLPLALSLESRIAQTGAKIMTHDANHTSIFE